MLPRQRCRRRAHGDAACRRFLWSRGLDDTGKRRHQRRESVCSKMKRVLTIFRLVKLFFRVFFRTNIRSKKNQNVLIHPPSTKRPSVHAPCDTPSPPCDTLCPTRAHQQRIFHPCRTRPNSPSQRSRGGSMITSKQCQRPKTGQSSRPSCPSASRCRARSLPLSRSLPPRACSLSLPLARSLSLAQALTLMCTRPGRLGGLQARQAHRPQWRGHRLHARAEAGC